MKHVLNFYVGDPDPKFGGEKQKRGQNKHGQVRCLVWVYMTGKGDFFSAQNEYTICTGGSGIGHVKTLVEGRAKLHAYAKASIAEKLAAAEDRARRCREALEVLGDDPAMLERFAGPYMRKDN